jgi:hypothetical protein
VRLRHLGFRCGKNRDLTNNPDRIRRRITGVMGDLLTQVQSCASRGWFWIREHLSFFLPADLSDSDTLKEISELALLCGNLSHWSDARGRTELRVITEFLAEFLSTPELVHFARKSPSHYNYLIAYLSLRAAGYRNPAYEEALVAIKRMNYATAIELVPYRSMELQHIRWKAGLSKRRPNWGPTYRATTLGRCRSPVYLTNADVYSITHTLFYLTDFSGPTPQMPSCERRRAQELVETLVVHYCRMRNWDIVAELLVNLVALDYADRLVFEISTKELLDAWREDGALPGPTFSDSAESAQPAYVFKHCYHTTLVGLLFCAAYVHRIATAVGNCAGSSA